MKSLYFLCFLFCVLFPCGCDVINPDSNICSSLTGDWCQKSFFNDCSIHVTFNSDGSLESNDASFIFFDTYESDCSTISLFIDGSNDPYDYIIVSLTSDTLEIKTDKFSSTTTKYGRL